jgi:hypothetical protein
LTVQRILAAFVLSVIGFLPMAEGWQGAMRVPELPVCCRAHGKHQCAMRSGSDTAPALYSICDKYSLPVLGSAVANTPAFEPKAIVSFLEPIVSHLVAPAQAESRLAVSFERSRQKRGPPSLSS